MGRGITRAAPRLNRERIMDTFKYFFCVSSEAHGINDLEGQIEVSVVSYGEPARINCLPEHADPGCAPEFELGAIEVITGYDRDDSGRFIWHYAPMPEGPLSDALAALIRESIDLADVETAAMENAAGDREDRGDWLRDQKRDELAERSVA